MNHGSSSRPNFLFATPRHIPDTDRSLHQMCLSPDCVSANIPPPQLPQSSPKEGFSSILSFWADIEQSSSRSTSITMPRLNPPLTNGLSRCRVGGGINHLSSGTTSDMDSISNSTSSRPQKNEPLKPSGSEESSDIDNFSAPYEIIVPPKPPKTPKPILSTPQTKVFQPPYGIGYGEYANIPKNGPPLPPPVPPEKEDSPPILPPKSPILRPVSQDNRILLNGIQSMPRLNGNSLKSNEPKPPSPIPIKILLQNGKSNHNKPVMANGNTKRSNFNRFSPNFRYSFNRPPDEKPNKISTARSISAYGAVRELTPELPLKSTSKRPATAMDTNVGVFQVRYPTMSVTHAPTNVPIVKAETDQNTTQSFNHTPVPRRSSSRGGESSFQFGGENRRSLRTNGYVNVAPNFCRNSRPSSEIRHQHSTKSISNRSGGGGFGGNTDTSSVSPNHSDENLVTVTILPNAEGQYGFNVSGGSDQKRPVVVSRVGERMPAATCCPRLHAGDQIILINYRDISDYTQDQVISSIRKSAESQSGVLELVVKPNIYLEENAMDDQETGDAPPRPPKSLVSTNRDSSPLSSWLHPSAPKRSESSPISNNRHPNQRPAPQSTPVQTQYQVVSQNSPPKITPKPRFGSSTTVKVKSTSGNGPRKALISDTEALFHSIREIEAGLADGSLVKQFEACSFYQLCQTKSILSVVCQVVKLERGNPNATMVDAKANENIPKNRYRDISPYDHSRVRIQGVDGDYINASFVKLKIPKWGLQREYIASQGPLPSTCADFWQMCWEQESELIVMLTSVREQGRVKCHKYWPDLNQTSEFTWTHAKSSKLTSSVKCIQLRISNIKEEVTADIAYREFHLQRIVTTTKDMLNSTGPTRHRIISFSHDKGPAILNGSDVRRIVQLQYISWPDHGVPNNCSDLIAFVERMRSLREQGDSACTIVHCSAGIGRTGVVILLDTAMDMIRAHIPLRPLEIVRQMREYREMLIQTPAQFQFVSNAIVQYYYG